MPVGRILEGLLVVVAMPSWRRGCPSTLTLGAPVGVTVGEIVVTLVVRLGPGRAVMRHRRPLRSVGLLVRLRRGRDFRTDL